MLEYLDIATKTTAHQIFSGFVVVFIIALILNYIGKALRNLLTSKLGSFYDYFVLPGCMCHELGRTLGCWITGVSVDKFEIFNLRTDDSERIPLAVSTNKRFAFIRRFFILTGPIWIGSIIVGIITTVAAGTEILPSYSECFGDGSDFSLASYALTLLTESIYMVGRLFFVWHWTSPFCLLVFYILFCVGSQITISGKSMLLIWQSVIGVFLILFVLNLIPGLNTGIAWLGDKIMPAVFMLHVTLLFVAMLNLAFLIVARFLLKKVKGGKRSAVQSEHSHTSVIVHA